MPHTTLVTTPEILCKLVRLHAACMRRINYSVGEFEEGTVHPEEAVDYARDIRQAESIARILRIPLREQPPDGGFPGALQSGLTGVFLKERKPSDFLIEEHHMSHTSPMQGLLNKGIGTEADGWTLIAIKF